MEKEVLEFLLALTLLITVFVVMNLVNKVRALKGLVSSANDFNLTLNQTLIKSNETLAGVIALNEQSRDKIEKLREEVQSWKAKSLP